MTQIGTVKLQTQNSGVVDVPVFETGDSASGVFEFVRVETASGTGFIPVTDPADATYPYLRVQSQNNGIVAVTDTAGTDIPDSGLLHDYNALEESTTSTFEDRVGSNDLSANGDPTLISDGINGKQTIRLDGVDDSYVGDGITQNGDYTTAGVIDFRETDNNQNILRNAGSSGYRFEGRASDGDDTWDWTANGIAVHRGSGVEHANPEIFVASYNDSSDNLILDINDIEVINTSANFDDVSSSDNIQVGEVGDVDFTEVDLGRLLFYEEFNDDEGRSEIHDALASEWGF